MNFGKELVYWMTKPDDIFEYIYIYKNRVIVYEVYLYLTMIFEYEECYSNEFNEIILN